MPRPYEDAANRVLEYLLDNEPLWHGEHLDFEEGSDADRNGHVFPAFLAFRAWLTRGALDLDLGSVVVTDRARESVPPEEIDLARDRHRLGDWGDIGAYEWAANDAIEAGELADVDFLDETDARGREAGKIISVYHAKDGTRFLVETDPRRHVTTIYLAAEETRNEEPPEDPPSEQAPGSDSSSVRVGGLVNRPPIGIRNLS